MFDIRSLFSKGKTPLSSSEIGGRIQMAQAEMQTVRTAISQMEAARPKVLLEADDRAAEEHDMLLAAHRRQLDRLAAAVDELEREKGEAEARERVAALDKLERETAAKVKDGLALLDAYERHATEIAGILERLSTIENEIDEANRLLSADRRNRITGPQESRREIPGRTIPAHTEENLVIPPGASLISYAKRSGENPPAVQRVPERREVGENFIPALRLPPLPPSVRLPAARIDDRAGKVTPDIWPKQKAFRTLPD